MNDGGLLVVRQLLDGLAQRLHRPLVALRAQVDGRVARLQSQKRHNQEGVGDQTQCISDAAVPGAVPLRRAEENFLHAASCLPRGRSQIPAEHPANKTAVRLNITDHIACELTPERKVETKKFASTFHCTGICINVVQHSHLIGWRIPRTSGNRMYQQENQQFNTDKDQ